MSLLARLLPPAVVNAEVPGQQCLMGRRCRQAVRGRRQAVKQKASSERQKASSEEQKASSEGQKASSEGQKARGEMHKAVYPVLTGPAVHQLRSIHKRDSKMRRQADSTPNENHSQKGQQDEKADREHFQWR